MSEVPMTTILCRWCGAPYGVPTVMFENSARARSLLCPSGHSYDSSLSIQQRLQSSHAHIAEIESRNARLVHINNSLRGVITRMKKATP